MSGRIDQLRQRVGGIAGILCGGGVSYASLQLPLGSSRLIGPGAVPLVLSLAMIGLSVVLLVRPAAAEPDDDENGGVHGAAMVGLVALMVGLFGLALNRLGFLVSATALMYGLYAIGEERFVSLRALIWAVLSAGAAYLLFVVALSVNMPAGTLWGY